ncbi:MULTISPECIES: GNAT family N-acetyltransferase [Roseivirga]|uniref:GNAT family N-acetyltransferase n=1 Tax=Roseivirga TaxID=290180 RepID=UPI001B2E9302|nr:MULTISPECIES: GNAT family N-acetyltransferase [Roseivirga]MBO6660141.1 GNAT family N-acetyltransferase [Roseivirga sp.]MBO6759346.1 GNAT family N-acetyltransferase [Roseivirga sp.]MBO6907122.1 GNAT family N-acetyltransferase [Roseivirga sp.]WPZ09519.1 GNAT family N-acetyltransferase [Roseivirga spongicola]
MTILHITPEQTYEIRHRVMWPDQPFDYVKIANDNEGLHFGYFVDGKLISVISGFFNEETKEAQFRKFATLQEFQSKGYGSQLLSHLIEEFTARGAIRIWCNARVIATALYERFGMHKTNQTFTKLGIDYVVMEKVI